MRSHWTNGKRTFAQAEIGVWRTFQRVNEETLFFDRALSSVRVPFQMQILDIFVCDGSSDSSILANHRTISSTRDFDAPATGEDHATCISKF